MKTFRNYFLVSSIVCLVSACTLNGTFENREEDRQEGEIITTSFYNYMKEGKFGESYSLFAPAFFTVTDTTHLAGLYQQILKDCGAIKSCTVKEWKTSIVKGANPISGYLFVYQVDRERCSTKETIALTKEEGIIRIISYNVTSQ